MDPIGLFVSFSNAIGFGPYWTLVLIAFLIFTLPNINKPLPLAFLLLNVALVFFGKSVFPIFELFALEIVIIMIGFYIWVKDPNINGIWFWLGLGFLAFVW